MTRAARSNRPNIRGKITNPPKRMRMLRGGCAVRSLIGSTTLMGSIRKSPSDRRQVNLSLQGSEAATRDHQFASEPPGIFGSQEHGNGRRSLGARAAPGSRTPAGPWGHRTTSAPYRLAGIVTSFSAGLSRRVWRYPATNPRWIGEIESALEGNLPPRTRGGLH